MAGPFGGAPAPTTPGPFGGAPAAVAAPPAASAPPAAGPQFPSAPAPSDAVGFGADPFAQPAEGGAAGPRVRDLDRRLVMVHKLSEEMRQGLKHKEGDALVRTLTCDVAVLSGGMIMMSPSQNDLEGVVQEWKPAPSVVEGMWINQKGLVNRLKKPISLGWITRSPMEALVKIGIDTPAKLNAKIDEDPRILNDDRWSTNMFWTILPYSEDDAKVARDWLATADGQTFLSATG